MFIRQRSLNRSAVFSQLSGQYRYLQASALRPVGTIPGTAEWLLFPITLSTYVQVIGIEGHGLISNHTQHLRAGNWNQWAILLPSLRGGRHVVSKSQSTIRLNTTNIGNDTQLRGTGNAVFPA
jgi:hypothetical protein